MEAGGYMALFAIGDLHLGGMALDKPMHIFGQAWEDHPQNNQMQLGRKSQ